MCFCNLLLTTEHYYGLLTCSAQPRVLVVSIGAIRSPVAQVLDGDASAVGRTPERLERFALPGCNEKDVSVVDDVGVVVDVGVIDDDGFVDDFGVVNNVGVVNDVGVVDVVSVSAEYCIGF